MEIIFAELYYYIDLLLSQKQSLHEQLTLASQLLKKTMR